MTLIGLVGRARAGKDTVCHFLQQYDPRIRRIAFADPMKEEFAAATGMSVEFIEEHKEVFRPGLKWWGTEFRRDLFGQDYWIIRFEDRLRELERQDPDVVVVVTDVRFENEASAVSRLGGTLVRVVREGPKTTVPARLWAALVRVVRGGQGDDHRSETELDHRPIDNVLRAADRPGLAAEVSRFIRANPNLFPNGPIHERQEAG